LAESKQFYYENGNLYVIGVTQEKLNSAYNEYIMDKPGAILTINSVSEQNRARFVTCGEIQQYVYLDKYNEAIRFIAGYEDNYLYLTKEAEAYGISVSEFATMIINQYQISKEKLSEIEKLRRISINNVKNASTKSEVESSLDNFFTSLNQI
jgi:hypothetical protein